MFRLCTKLKGLKPELKIFNSKHYVSINSKVAQAREDLTRLQLLHLQDPSNSDLANAEKEKRFWSLCISVLPFRGRDRGQPKQF